MEESLEVINSTLDDANEETSRLDDILPSMLNVDEDGVIGDFGCVVDGGPQVDLGKIYATRQDIHGTRNQILNSRQGWGELFHSSLHRHF